MLKAAILAGLTSLTVGVTVSGKGVALVDGELYPSAIDGTRLGIACEGGNALSQTFQLDGDDFFDVVGVEIVGFPTEDVEYLEGDFTVEYRTTNVLVTFNPVSTLSPIRQSAAVVHLLSADESVLFSFGVGGTSIGPNLAISQVQKTAISTMQVGSAPTTLNVFNDQPICPTSTFADGSVESTDGFSAELSGSRLIVSYTGASTGFVTGAVTVQSAAMGAVTLELTAGQDTSTCSDYLINGEAWTDSEKFPCSAYAENRWCDPYGSDYANNGFVAKQACCACQGGFNPAAGETQPVSEVSVCFDHTFENGVAWNDAGGDLYTCAEWYSQDGICARDGGKYEFAGVTANQACCVCGGGSEVAPVVVFECFDHEYENGDVWNDSDENYSCSSYYTTDYPDRCNENFQNQGFTAKTACCSCGGGSKGAAFKIIV